MIVDARDVPHVEDYNRVSTGTFSKDVFSQGAVNWVFLGLFH